MTGRREYRVPGPVAGACETCSDGWVDGPLLPPLKDAPAPYTSSVPCRRCLLGEVHRRRGVRAGWTWLEAAAA